MSGAFVEDNLIRLADVTSTKEPASSELRRSAQNGCWYLAVSRRGTSQARLDRSSCAYRRYPSGNWRCSQRRRGIRGCPRQRVAYRTRMESSTRLMPSFSARPDPFRLASAASHRCSLPLRLTSSNNLFGSIRPFCAMPLWHVALGMGYVASLWLVMSKPLGWHPLR
jgi:hypothetical protein